MADVVSSVTSIFSTILQGFEYIQVARSFEDDVGLYQSKLAIIQLRLSRWGAAVGLNPENEDGSGEGTSQNGQLTLAINTDAEAVEDILHSINQALKKAKKESAKWKPAGEDSVDLDHDDDDVTPKHKRLKSKIRDIVKKRHRKISVGMEGAKWALYKKEQCEALTTTLLGLIEQLEKAVESETKLDELSQGEAKVIDKSLNTLLEAVGDCDPRLQAAASETLMDNMQAALNNISISATTNYGLQMGINRGHMQGFTFGTGQSVNHQWNAQSNPPRD